jgi:hypothetical protein
MQRFSAVGVLLPSGDLTALGLRHALQSSQIRRAAMTSEITRNSGSRRSRADYSTQLPPS